MSRFTLPRLLAPAAGADEPAAVEAFRVARNDVVASLALTGSVLLMAATILWWPLDAHVLPSDAAVRGFHAMRVRGLVLESVAVLGFWLSSWFRERALVLGPLLYVAWLTSTGHALGGIPGDDVTALADAWLGVVPLVLMPETAGRRAGWTMLAAAGLALGYFGLHAEKLRVPGAPMQLSFGTFAAVLTFGLGEVTYRVFRYGFFEQRARARANSALEGMTASLAAQVNARTAQLRELAAHLTEVQEAERRRVARDLHDDLGQNLTALRYSLARLEKHVRGDEAVDLLDDISAVLDGTFATVRGVLSDLRPRILDDLGLAAALEWSTDRLGASGEVVATLDADEDARKAAATLSHEASLALFRVAQEASTNALKHARATSLALSLRAEGDSLTLAVSDDGGGFDPTAPVSGFGLLGLRERMLAVGGELQVRSAPRAGTTVTARVAIRSPSPA